MYTIVYMSKNGYEIGREEGKPSAKLGATLTFNGSYWKVVSIVDTQITASEH